ncbi:unnamed protein product [Pylaiella littoralis]
MKPWRPEGIHGWFLNRRASCVNANIGRFPVFSAGLACSSDASNYFIRAAKRLALTGRTSRWGARPQLCLDAFDRGNWRLLDSPEQHANWMSRL